MNLEDRIHGTIVDMLSAEHADITTPAYIYSAEQVGENYKQLKELLATPLVVSLKANHCPELLARVALYFDDGCEVASLGELRLRAGSRQKVYINTPAYTTKMVEVASRYDAVFIIDHIAQLDILADVKKKQALNNPVLLRINFDTVTKGEGTPPKDHFGMDSRTLCEAAAKARDIGIKVAGLHVFCGSNGFVGKSAGCVDAVEKLHDAVGDVLGYPLEVVNLGGGIPADWREKNIDFAAYRKSLEKLKGKASVIHEAGRAIYGSAGYFVTEVASVKSIGSRHFVVCDGGMAQNFLLAKTEHVIRKYDRPTVVGAPAGDVRRDYTFVGASCNRDDVIGEIKDSTLDIRLGNKIVFNQCGAYNATYTVNNFLALKHYAEYII
jgi:diaminopimelate decarboxylase